MRIGWLLVLALGCAHKSSEATAAPASVEAGSAGDSAKADDETLSCATDLDCALTNVEAGACCPMLCTPRVVTRKRAEALEANVDTCNKGRPCPHPLCRPPLETITPACVQGRCIARTGPAN